MEEGVGQDRSEGGMDRASSNYSAKQIVCPRELANMGQRKVMLARLLINSGAFQRETSIDLGEEGEHCRFTIGLENDSTLTVEDVKYAGRVLRGWMDCYRLTDEFVYFASDSRASERLGRSAIPDRNSWLSYVEYPNPARFAHDPPAYCPSGSSILLIVEAVKVDTQHIFDVIDQLRLNGMIVNKVMALVDLSNGALFCRFKEYKCKLQTVLSLSHLVRVGEWYRGTNQHRPISCS